MAHTSLKSYIFKEMLTVSNPLILQLFLSKASFSVIIPAFLAVKTAQTFSYSRGRLNLIRTQHRLLRPHTQADSLLKVPRTANLEIKGHPTHYTIQIVYSEVWGCDVMVIFNFLVCPVKAERTCPVSNGFFGISILHL